MYIIKSKLFTFAFLSSIFNIETLFFILLFLTVCRLSLVVESGVCFLVAVHGLLTAVTFVLEHVT